MKILPLSVALSSLMLGLALPEVARANTFAPAEQPLVIAQRVLLQENGVLEPGDEVLPSDNSLYDTYTFDGRSGQQITISMDSSEFDTYLAIFSPEGELLAENDDSNGTTNSFISVTLPSTGTYIIVANGYDSSSQGRYQLTVR